VDVLGSEDFLPPICMLLIEKAANRVIRQSSEVQNSLALPLAILEHNSLALQIRVCIYPIVVIPIHNLPLYRRLLQYCTNANGLLHEYLVPK
jgi:hypothetical protein